MLWCNVFPSAPARRTRSSSASTRSTASAAAAQIGLPPKVLPCRPGVSSCAAGPIARHAPIGRPAAETLGQRHHVGRDAVVLVREKRSGAAHSGLHLVEDQQRTVPGGDLAGGRQVAVGWHDDAALPHDRLEEHRGGVVTDRRGQRVDVAVRHVGDVTGQRRERRLLARLAGQRQRAHRPAVETPLAPQPVSSGR